MSEAADTRGAVLQVSADLRKLEKAFEKAEGKVKVSSVAMAKHATRFEKQAVLSSTNVSSALGNLKTASLQQLAPGVDRYSTALSNLGVAGIAAGVAIAAVTAAFVGARQAAAFADDIADTANRLHVTTDALQEYRFAIRAAGGEEKGADEALEAFSITLGKAQQGLAKSTRGFKALGFSKEQIDSFKSVDEALVAVTERIAGLSTVQQDAIIDQLGLKGLKPLIAEGVTEMQRLRAEAHKVGVVMDAELVARGGELNDQFETVAKVIDVQLKSALVDLGPVLVGLLQLIANMASAAANVADAFRDIDDKRTKSLEAERSRRLERQFSGGPLGAAFAARDRSRIAAITAELNSRAAAAKPSVPKPTRELIDTSSKGGGGSKAQRDSAVQRTEQIEGQIASAERSVLQALLGLATSTEARLNLQKQIIAREGAIEESRLAKQAADIAADDGLTAAKKAELIARLDIISAATAEEARLTTQRLEAEAADAIAREQLELKRQDFDAQAELLELQASLTRSDAERGRIALELVRLATARERAELEGLIASKTVTDADKALARLKLAQLNQQAPQREEQARRTGSDAAREAGSIVDDVQRQGSLEERTAAMYAEIERLRQIDRLSEEEAAQAKAEVNARYHEQRLAGAQEFFGNLATLSQSSNKTLAAIGKAAAITQATIDGVLAVQKALASAPPPLNFALAAAAGVAAAVNVAKIAGMRDGGPVRGPGGGRDDRVLRWLSNGEHVVNEPAARRNRPLLDAMNAGADLSRLLPAPQVPAKVAGPRAGDSFAWYGDMNFNGGPPSTHIARRQTQAQAQSGVMAGLALAKRKGIAG